MKGLMLLVMQNLVMPFHETEHPHGQIQTSLLKVKKLHEPQSQTNLKAWKRANQSHSIP